MFQKTCSTTDTSALRPRPPIGSSGRRFARSLAIAALFAWSLLASTGCDSTTAARGKPGKARDAGKTSSWNGVVTHVTDGDTLWVRPANGGAPRKVRVDGIDAPEICQSGGVEARQALTAKVAGRTVAVRTRRLDDWKRELARVSLERGDDDVGAWMVSGGHAWSYRWRRDPGPYAQEEQAARRTRRGLFAQGNPRNPREFRKQHGPCDRH